MKRWILTLLCFAFPFAAIVSAHSQVVPAATSRVLNVRVGAFASAFQPDYFGTGEAYTAPNRMYGAGAYVDAHFTRWIQPELEVRFNDFNEYPEFGQTINQSENTYSIGDRVPIKTFRNFTPYGKFLVGIGNGDFLTGNALVFTYGGGVDYRLNRKFTIRCADFEYQQWKINSALTIYPYGLSAGLSYRIF
ncbi:MAG: outer membrane beta-barrel protein [Terracidiphilus sp.]|jgi:hypothetical protein